MNGSVSAAPRYEALDSWRGVAATMVAVYHLDVFSHFQSWLLVRNGTLYVDFFFVLSGFVITANYLERLQRGFGVARFMLLRAARVWPLHAFILLVFVLTELTFQPLISAFSPTGRAAFSGVNNVETIFEHVFLVHSLNLALLSWNVPSWSISVEFWTYLLFALAALLFRARIGTFTLIALVLFPLAFLTIPGLNMGAAVDWGLLRCAYGFCAGGAAYALFSRGFAPIRALKAAGPLAGTAAEALAVVVTALFIAYGKGGPLWSFAPFIFALTVVVFAAEKGAISGLLKLRPFLLMGALSYSIYMVHYFILLRIRNVAQVTEKAVGVDPWTIGTGDGGRPVKLLGAELWQGDLLTLAMLLLVFGTSYLTWRYVEMPGHAAGRAFAARRWGGPGRLRA